MNLVSSEKPFARFITELNESDSEQDLNELDKYRRELNTKFANEIIGLVDVKAPDSVTESSSSSGGSINGQLIYMHIWLGSELGHQPLYGLCSDDPGRLAFEFLERHNLSQDAQGELKEMIVSKIQEYLTIFN